MRAFRSYFKMAAQVPPAVVVLPEMDQVLFLCGITDAAARACLILAEGLDTLDEFGDATNDEIANMAKRNESRSTAAARVQLGMGRIKRLKAVAFWVCKQRREGVPMDAGNLTVVIAQTIAEKTLAPLAGKKDEKLFESEKFDPKHYKKWSRLMGNYLLKCRQEFLYLM